MAVVALAWRAALAAIQAPEDLLAIGSLERADALLYGCAAAIAVRLGWRPRAWMVWPGLALVAFAVVGFGGTAGYPALVIGTAISRLGQRVWSSASTTPLFRGCAVSCPCARS